MGADRAGDLDPYATGNFGQLGDEGPGKLQARYGPDGMPLDEGQLPEDEEFDEFRAQAEHPHHGLEIHDQGWFQAESNRLEQDQLAQIHLSKICRAVDERHMSGICREGRWTNDPEEFPDLRLRGTVTSNAVVPFPPHDQQFYICGVYDPETSKLRQTALPSHVPDEDGNSSWVRLVDFADHADAAHLFDEFSPHRTHYGRIIQGSIDNGYFVEALQAVALRPKLAKQLFHCWDSRRSVYVARLYKHGTWMRIELDDYVPVGPPAKGSDETNVPICCRSEFFPHVLWPSLAEKAYAKLHTCRGSTMEATEEDRGGWEALAGGGRVEEALADLTGGIAGRFNTCDISMDRLFVYLYELQRDTLFVCRPHQVNCELHGVRLNPYYPHVVNRAVAWEGRLYVQMFCGAPGVFDGGLQDINVPYTLVHAQDYPETTSEGFFWITAMDFHEYFDTVFECRLVNSGDVSLPNMPPPRIPGSMPLMPGMMPGLGMPPPGSMPPPVPPPGVVPPFGFPGAFAGTQHLSTEGSPLPWFEWVFANPGQITRHNQPEFSVRVPDRDVPCEIVCSVEQLDPRMLMRTPARKWPAAVLAKVYENVDGVGGVHGGFYSTNLVSRSAWLPVRDAMVAFTVTRGGEFKIVAELPTLDTQLDRMIFRCYTSRPNVVVTAFTALKKHNLTEPTEPPRATRLTVVGSGHAKNGIDDEPGRLDEEHDSLRKPEFDYGVSWEELRNDVKECSLM